MRTTKLLALSAALLLALVACGDDEVKIENQEEGMPNMIGQAEVQRVPKGEAASRTVQYAGDPEAAQWTATLIDYHCDVDIDQANEAISEYYIEPYVGRDGYKVCSATLEYTNTGNVPMTDPEQPYGVVSGNSIYQQSHDYSMFGINQHLMDLASSGPFNPGDTVKAETYLEVPEDIDVTAIYLDEDDNSNIVFLETE